MRPPTRRVHLLPEIAPQGMTLAVEELLQEIGRTERALDGLSFAPTLLGKPAGQKRHDYMYWEAAGTKQDTVRQAVRWGKWKALRGRPGTAWELYDLEADPGERKDVAAGHPDVLKRLDAICREAHTPERRYEPAAKESAADYVK